MHSNWEKRGLGKLCECFVYYVRNNEPSLPHTQKNINVESQFPKTLNNMPKTCTYLSFMHAVNILQKTFKKTKTALAALTSD